MPNETIKLNLEAAVTRGMFLRQHILSLYDDKRTEIEISTTGISLIIAIKDNEHNPPNPKSNGSLHGTKKYVIELADIVQAIKDAIKEE